MIPARDQAAPQVRPPAALTLDQACKTETAETLSDASRNRVRRLGATALSGFVGKGVAAAANYAMIPMLLHAMGVELFGIWSTFYSLLTMAISADLGIGNGMLNAIAASNARKDREDVQQTITSGLLLLTAIAAMLGVALSVFFPIVGRMVMKSGLPETTIQPAMGGLAVFALYALLSMPLTTGDRIATALQEGFILNLIRACILVFTLGVVFVVIRMGGNFVSLCAASVWPGLLGSCLTWVFVTWNRPWLSPALSQFRWDRARTLLRSGLGFFLIQLVGAIGFNIDTLIIANGFGTTAAADFAIASRYFTIATVIGNIVLSPLWPAYADAASRGDFSWAKHTLVISLISVLGVGGIITVSLFHASDWLMPLWLGTNFTLNRTLMASMAGWTALSLIGSAIAMFWNGMHWLRLQCFLGALFVSIALPVKLWLCGRGTIDQFVLANILLFFSLEILPGLVFTFLTLRRPKVQQQHVPA